MATAHINTMSEVTQPRIFVAGHRGMVGSAIVRELQAKGYKQIIVCERGELDLMDKSAVDSFFKKHQPDWVFLAAAKVGGILANRDYPADFIFENLCIQNNVIDSAYRNGVVKLLFLGSSCIYPKETAQPMVEGALLSGPLEETNQWYAVAKIAGIKLCQAYREQYGFDAISLMPTNLYGPGDNFNLETSHVLPALIRRFDEAKRQCLDEVTLWGTGTPRREFLHVDDLASACLFAMQVYSGQEILNVGVGKDLTIAELAHKVASIVGYQGRVNFDPLKPDGTPRKLLDIQKLQALGWQSKVALKEGIMDTYCWYMNNNEYLRQ